MDKKIYQRNCAKNGHNYVSIQSDNFNGIICTKCGPIDDSSFSKAVRKRVASKLKRKK